MAQPYKSSGSQTFRQLWSKQEGLCAICGEPMPDNRFDMAHARLWAKWRPTIDHIQPRSRGGSNDISNLQLTHGICNKRKGNTLPKK